MGRDSILKETTLQEYKHDPKAGNPDLLLYVSSAGGSGHGDNHDDAHAAEGHGHEEDAHAEVSEGNPYVAANKVNLWDDHTIGSGHRWGMTIDLNKCIGCGACVTACGSENNVPVVGKEEVRRGRDMHWLRIDRYYSSDMTEDKAAAEGIGAIDKFTAMEAAAEAPQVAYQPVMCQHCNHAPCETVCPVAATTHSNEGLNMMTYNRCIGTRYCANNCPYKVRRFNWFQYHNGNQDFGKNPANDDLGRMVLNPDVVVRDRGVMEKCSFCVQGIQAAKLKAKKEGRKVADAEVQSACSESCPTNAITFGDLNDKDSWVAEKAHDERSYSLLEEVGVQPNVYYMTKVRNVEANEA
jgi:molybdopterin-containing oxidoreductase family iron-sulfur binding subunit